MSDDRYQATYSYLPAGPYTFLVKSENAEGTSGNSVTRFQFTIQRPFYQTWWFYSLIVLLGVLLLYWYDRERMKRKSAIQQMRSSIADNLHEEVTKTLNNITILSEIARLKADKDLEKSKEYIDQINDKSRKMMYNMEDMLWSIHPENDSMQKMLLRMQEFAEGYEKEYDLPIELQMDPRLDRIRLDMLQRQELFFIFKDAMNCMVHSFKAKRTSISLDLEGRILVMKMRAEKQEAEMQFDNNCVYLKDIHKRAANLKARVDFLPDSRFVSMILQVDVHD
jgi:signal transduction histidine kinase